MTAQELPEGAIGGARPLEGGRSRRALVVKVAKAVVSVLVVAALAAFLYRERQSFLSALRMDLRDFGLIFGFTLAAWVANVIAQAALLRALGRPLPFLEILALHVGGGLLNHLPMRPGTLYRAHFLKERTGLVYAHFTSFTVMNLLVPIAAAGLIGGLTLAVAYGFALSEASLLLFTLLGCAAVSLALLLVPLPRSSSTSRVARAWNDLVAGRATIALYPRVFVIVTLCHAVSLAFSALRFLGAYASMGVEVSAAALLVLGAVDVGVRLVSITPGGIGMQEIVVAASATLLGVPLATGIVAASVVRAVALVCYVAFGSASLAWLQRSRAARAQRDGAGDP